MREELESGPQEVMVGAWEGGGGGGGVGASEESMGGDVARLGMSGLGTLAMESW